MTTASGRRRTLLFALVALLAVVVISAVAVSGNFFLPHQPTYPTATVEGKVVGKAYTAEHAVGTVINLFFLSTSNQSQGKGIPATLNPDGTYSVSLKNGMNYTVYMYVIDPNNDEDSGVCQAQTVSLRNLNEPTYMVDVNPVNCG
jgi:hypothetical protein